MAGARGSVVALTALVAIAGCASVGETPTSTPLPQPSIESAQPASASPVVASELPVVSVKPARTPKPAKSRQPGQPSASTAATAPNLVITKFVSDVDRLVVGKSASGRVVIKNDGTADSGPFDLHVGYTYTTAVGGSGEGTASGIPVDSLGPGESIQMPVDLTPPEEGTFTFVATSDASGAVAESNEDDNTTTLTIESVRLANLLWAPGALTVEPDPTVAGGYHFRFELANNGAADVDDSFSISLDYASTNGSVSGNFPTQTCCVVYDGPALRAGGTAGFGVAPYKFPTFGTYVVTATIDPDNEVDETDESGNVATYQVTVQ